MKKALSISIPISIIIFLLKYYYQYQNILSNQPIFDAGGKITNQNFTSFPPSSAWIPALTVACFYFLLITIVVAFFIFIFKKDKK